MQTLILGATGMVGQGVLRECVLAPDVERVVTLGRNPTRQASPKLREIVHADLLDLSTIESQLTGLDACFFCLGVTSAGMSEADYKRVTQDYAVSVARTLVRLNPAMTFIFVSGAGADSSERGRVMWARVKGAAENALLAMPFKAVYVFRPAFIVPLHGITSRTPMYRALYTVIEPFVPLIKRFAPNYVTSTEQIGRAMLTVVRRGHAKRVLESRDIDVIRDQGPVTGDQ